MQQVNTCILIQSSELCILPSVHTHIYTVSAFAYFQFYCFETGSINIPSVADGLRNTSTVQTFLNTSESFADAGCQFTNPLRDFFAANAPWYEYQKETWLALGE